tara:strand:+ start:216 stop:872 length:657 start_codon:yes stop_codon:yes gene_type:complete
MYSEYIYDNRTSPLGINTNIWMWQGFDKTINYNALNNFLLDFEKELLKKPELNDGGTGVGGTTARYKHYNLLNLQHSEIQKLEKYIIYNIQSFLNYKQIKCESVYIQCWYNVLDKDKQIAIHQHRGVDDYHLSFISGHLSTTENNTKTYYTSLNKKNAIGLHNEVGKLILFPSYIPHYTDKNINNNKRISIAFDVYPSIEFIDPSYVKSGIIKKLMLR